MPAVWEDFQSLLKLCPENTLERSTPEGVHQVYRWVHGLSYRDDQGRTWCFNAIECQETVNGKTTTFQVRRAMAGAASGVLSDLGSNQAGSNSIRRFCRMARLVVSAMTASARATSPRQRG